MSAPCKVASKPRRPALKGRGKRRRIGWARTDRVPAAPCHRPGHRSGGSGPRHSDALALLTNPVPAADVDLAITDQDHVLGVNLLAPSCARKAALAHTDRPL